jgi:hypothetical protein
VDVKAVKVAWNFQQVAVKLPGREDRVGRRLADVQAPDVAG